MSDTSTGARVPVVLSLTDEELLALSSMTGHRWPRPLHAVPHSGDSTLQAASGLRSLGARGLLEPELPQDAAEIMGAVLAVFAERPSSLTLAVTDGAFVIDAGFPVLEILLLPGEPLAVSSLTLGVHTLRQAPLEEILDSFAEWVDEWSRSGRDGALRATAFVRDGQGSGVAGAVLAPHAARLHGVAADTWETVAVTGSASPRALLEDLVHQVGPAAVS